MRTNEVNNKGGLNNPSGNNQEGSSSDPKNYARSVNQSRAPAGRDERTPVNYTKQPTSDSKTTKVFRSNASSGPGSNPSSTFSPHTRVQVGQRK